MAFSRDLEQYLKTQDIPSWRCSAWTPDEARPKIDGTDLLLSVGGDGTILRASRVAIPECIPILGINLGRLGFLTELRADEVKDILPRLLSGEGWIEERTILEASIPPDETKLYALNDIFVGRRSAARLVSITCRLNGGPLTTYRADGVIVATASGSTGYAMAAGGPVLHPQSKNMVLAPVASHFSFGKILVLPPATEIELKVSTTHDAMISIDGQLELPLNDGSIIAAKLSSHTARFLRLQPQGYFYRTLESRLKRNIE